MNIFRKFVKSYKLFSHFVVCNVAIFSYRSNNSNSSNAQFNEIMERIKELQQNIARLNITVQKTNTSLTDFHDKLKLEEEAIGQRHTDTEREFDELEKEQHFSCFVVIKRISWYAQY